MRFSLWQLIVFASLCCVSLSLYVNHKRLARFEAYDADLLWEGEIGQKPVWYGELKPTPKGSSRAGLISDSETLNLFWASLPTETQPPDIDFNSESVFVMMPRVYFHDYMVVYINGYGEAGGAGVRGGHDPYPYSDSYGCKCWKAPSQMAGLLHCHPMSYWYFSLKPAGHKG